ncbi:MAG: protein-L-isoaspartate(D-aspartate) O-methyltransferase [Parachlamydia sp.]|nr:protein-L-isoaspartate(D-aspartate) O-methyltransferase [Parachlamydia sp.]
MDDFHAQREAMVEHQISRRGVKDPATLKAMRDVPRHLFVPPDMQQYAYQDSPLPIGMDQTISQPYIVALMTEVAQLTPEARVLDIGTGSGYAAAVLACIASEVYSIERIEPLAQNAAALLKELGYHNVTVKAGDGTLGWPEAGPFDAIIVTAGAPVVPESFKSQLKEGGRVVIPVGDALSQQLVRLRKGPKGDYTRELIEHVRFVPLIGEQGW